MDRLEYFVTDTGLKFHRMPEPKSDDELPACWHVTPDMRMPLRIIHDDWNASYNYESRTINMTLRITNEMYAASPWEYVPEYGEFRARHGKPTFRIESLPYGWPSFFFSKMTEWQAGRMITDAFGWFDHGSSDEVRPFQLIFTGGQLLEDTGLQWRGFHVVSCMNTELPPPFTSDWFKAPHKWIKQYNVGHAPASGNRTFWQVDKGEVGGNGDLYCPSCVPGGLAAIEMEYVRRFPALPFSTDIFGTPITFVEYGFYGSTVFGKAKHDGLWYTIEEMLVTGTYDDKTVGGNADDHRLYINPLTWKMPKPIAIIGWQRS